MWRVRARVQRARSAGPGGGSVAIRLRAAADQRDLDRASHPPVALPLLSGADQRPVPEPGSPARVFGPRLQAAVVTLTARHRVSRRGIGELFGDLFGAAVLTGSVDAICQRASEALAGPHLQLQDWVLDQPAVHVDETGWRTRGEGCALWTATTRDAVFLQIAEHCNRAQFNALIGTSYPGIVISDRWNGYSHLDPARRQASWSHIKRDFHRHADGLAEQKIFGEAGVVLTRRVFAAWRAYQHHQDRDQLVDEITPIQTELRDLLEHASPNSRRTRWHRQFANNLLKIWPALWTFVTVDGVEPTNNPAERALRAPVIQRKISLGSQSDSGERFAERALSTAGTCRLQRRSLFTYLSDLLVAHNRGDPFPPSSPEAPTTERLPFLVTVQSSGPVGRDSFLVQRILQAWIAPRRRRSMTGGGWCVSQFILDLGGAG